MGQRPVDQQPVDQQPEAQALALAAVCPGERVLDLSGLAGGLALRIASVAASVEAVQPTEDLADEGRRLAETLGLDNIFFHTGRLVELPFDAGQFSLALWCRGLSQEQQPLGVLADVLRVLAPHGRLILQEITAFGRHELDLRLWELERLRSPTHLLFYTSDEIESLVRVAGMHTNRLVRGILTQSFDYWVGGARLTEHDVRRAKNELFSLTPEQQDLIDLSVTDSSISFGYPVETRELVRPGD